MNLQTNKCEDACVNTPNVKVLHQALEYFRDVTYLLSEQVARLEVLRNNLIGDRIEPECDTENCVQEPQNWAEALTLQIQRTEKVACDFRNLLDSLEQYI